MDPSTLPAPPAGPGTGVSTNPDGTVTVQVPPTPKPGPPPGTQAFTADDVERARQEEKSKLYSRLEEQKATLASMQTEFATLRNEREAREKAEADKAAAEAEVTRVKHEADLSAKALVEERATEWEAKFAKLNEERALEREAMAKEAQFNELRAYIQERVGAERAGIAPELVDFIAGDTREEIDQSIERVKEKTLAIAQSMSSAQQQQRSQMRGVATTGYTPNGPTDSDGGYQQLSAEDIKNMPMSRFAQMRGQLLGAASNNNANRGLFD